MEKDLLKNTIIKKIKQNISIDVRENPHQINKSTIENKSIKGIFVENISENSVKIIDYDSYDLYGKEVLLKIDDISNVKIIDKNNNYVEIESYDLTTGIFTFIGDSIFSSMIGYVEVLTISQNSNFEEDDDDYVTVSSLYSMTNVLNVFVEEEFRRFDIRVYTFKDDNENKSYYYMKKIREALKRDFHILDDNDMETKSMGYIYNPLKFDIDTPNMSSRICYGSIMIRFYNK